MCKNFGCLRSWQYCNSCPDILSRTGSDRIWRKWDGYRRLGAWAGVTTLAISRVCDRFLWTIGPRYVALSTLGGGWSMVCGTLDLVLCATGSYCSLVDVTLGDDGTVLGVWMTALGSEAWVCTVALQRIGHIAERCCV